MATAERIGAEKMIVLTRMWNGFQPGTPMPLIGSGQAVELVRRGIARYVDNLRSDNGASNGTSNAGRSVDGTPDSVMRFRQPTDAHSQTGQKTGRRGRPPKTDHADR